MLATDNKVEKVLHIQKDSSTPSTAEQEVAIVYTKIWKTTFPTPAQKKKTLATIRIGDLLSTS